MGQGVGEGEWGRNWEEERERKLWLGCKIKQANKESGYLPGWQPTSFLLSVFPSLTS